MLSEKHSFNLCSLVGNENRRSLSLILFYNKNYELESHFYRIYNFWVKMYYIFADKILYQH